MAKMKQQRQGDAEAKRRRAVGRRTARHSITSRIARSRAGAHRYGSQVDSHGKRQHQRTCARFRDGESVVGMSTVQGRQFSTKKPIAAQLLLSAEPDRKADGARRRKTHDHSAADVFHARHGESNLAEGKLWDKREDAAKRGVAREIAASCGNVRARIELALGSRSARRRIRRGDRVTIACSGGPDSVALAAAPRITRADGLALAIAHVNHGIRASAWQRWKASFLRGGNVRIDVRCDRRVQSRDGRRCAARHEALLASAERGINVIATAHHARSKAGRCWPCSRTGPDGIAGMRARRTVGPGIDLARPLRCSSANSPTVRRARFPPSTHQRRPERRNAVRRRGGALPSSRTRPAVAPRRVPR